MMIVAATAAMVCIAKETRAMGFAVDLAAERLREAGLHGEILVDLGDNLKSVSGKWRFALRCRFDDCFESLKRVGEEFYIVRTVV